MLVVCGLNGREWISPASCLNYIQMMLASDLACDIDYFIIPLANPDGYEFTWTTDRSWSKNRQKNPNSPFCPGIYLDANFDKFFDEESDENPCGTNYPGSRPEESDEVQMIAKYQMKLKNGF